MPVTTKINPSKNHGLDGPTNASEEIPTPSTIRTALSMAPTLRFIKTPFRWNKHPLRYVAEFVPWDGCVISYTCSFLIKGLA